MVRNNKVVVGMALVAGLFGVGVSGVALALPEMDVGTVPPIVAPQSMNPGDSNSAESDDVDMQVNAS